VLGDYCSWNASSWGEECGPGAGLCAGERGHFLHCIVCLRDVDVWVCAVKASGDAEAAPTALIDVSSRLEISAVEAAASCEILDVKWRGCVRRSLALLEQVPSGTVASPHDACSASASVRTSHTWNFRDEASELESTFRVCTNGMGLSVFSLPVSDALPAGPAGCAGPGLRDGRSMSAEAREVIHECLISEGFRPGRTFSPTERLWIFDLANSGASMAEKLVGLMLSAYCCYRVVEEEVPDGLQCVFFSWDEAKGAPCNHTVKSGEEYVTVAVLKFAVDREVRRWRLMATDIVPLPLGWLTSTPTLLTPFIRLANACMRRAYRRVGQKFCSIIAQRTVLSTEQPAWLAVCS